MTVITQKNNKIEMMKILTKVYMIAFVIIVGSPETK